MYEVRWLQVALDEVTTLWIDNPTQRDAITAATHAIDLELTADPFRQTESRGDDDRILLSYPLGVHVEVDTAKQTVWVLHVWRFRRRGQ
jgi:hypothetical protein